MPKSVIYENSNLATYNNSVDEIVSAVGPYLPEN